MLIGGLIYTGVLGFWTMGKIDRFISACGFLPDGDEEEGPKAVAKSGQAQICGSTDSSEIQKTVYNTPLT